MLSRHVIEVTSEGFLVDLASQKRGDVIKDHSALVQYLQTNIFEGFKASGKKQMLLFVHGGLTDRGIGMRHFTRNYQTILEGEFYPVFVVWPSGWKNTYVEHLLWVRQGLRAETFNEKAFSLATSPLVLLADVGRSLTRLPLVIANNSKSDIETVSPIRSREGGAAVEQYQALVRENYLLAIGDDYSLLRDRTVRTTTYWVTLPIKYFIGSLIDGFGKGAWDNMLRRTQVVYPARLDVEAVIWTDRLKQSPGSNAAVTQRKLTKRQERRARRYAAAGLPVFIEMLRSRRTNDPSQEVALVGHSMGAIILNRVVRDAKMDFSNIVYMGAACSVEDFSRSVLPYMKQHRQTQFYNLCLHPVAEAGEWYPMFVDLPPRGSLLVWLDNFLSNPVTEQERTLGRWRNLFRSGPTGEPIIRQFFNNDGASQLTNRLHFQAFSVGFGDTNGLRKIKYQWNEHPQPRTILDRCDHPLSHSEFTEMPYWKRQFWWTREIAGGKARQTADALKH